MFAKSALETSLFVTSVFASNTTVPALGVCQCIRDEAAYRSLQKRSVQLGNERFVRYRCTERAERNFLRRSTWLSLTRR